MKLLADMGVSIGVVQWLRGQGHDVVHLRDEGLQQLPDDEILRKSTAEGRVLLTFDLDFGDIVAVSWDRVASVVLFRVRNTRTAFVIERLQRVLPATAAALQSGAVVVVEDARYRVRRLPLGS